MINIHINGQDVTVQPEATIIEVAEQLGIYIPRFCYHKKLSIVATCRICLVEIIGNTELVLACSTVVQDGMQIVTDSARVIAARSAMLELMLINHPLDCPICDQAGACDLQDIVFQYGKGHIAYQEEKRAIYSKDFSPLIHTEMSRCIHCMRCVRFCREISGTNDLGTIDRGESTTIMLAPHTNIKPGVSCNIIDLCPVGALLAKPCLGTAKNWELIQTSSIAPHDAVGTNIYIYTAQNKIIYVVAKENDAINETWLADRDKFSYGSITHEDRLGQPLVKEGDTWVTKTWQEALNLVASKFTNIVNTYGAEEIGGLVSCSATIEEQYLLQKYLRGIGSNNIDHRLWQLDFTNQEAASLFPNLGTSITNVDKQQVLFIVGSNIHAEQAILALRIKKMVDNGGKVCVLNAIDSKFNFPVTMQQIVRQGDFVTPLLGIVKILMKKENINELPWLQKLLQNITPTALDKNMASLLLAASGKKLLLLGNFAVSSPHASLIILLSELIAKATQANCGQLTKGANTAGAWLTGCVPHRMPGGSAVTKIGKHAQEMLTVPLKSYLLLGVEPELDSIFGAQAINTIQQAEFVVALSSFTSKTLLATADVLLPITAFAEMAGTFVNMAGNWQGFNAAVKPYQASLPSWQVFNRLAGIANIAGFNYDSKDLIIDELTRILTNSSTELGQGTWQQCSSVKQVSNYTCFSDNIGVAHVNEGTAKDALMWLASVPMFQVDGLVRRANVLQNACVAHKVVAKLNSTTAKNKKLKDNDLIIVSSYNGQSINLPVVIDNCIPVDTIFMEYGTSKTLVLGSPYSYIRVEKYKQ